MSLGYHFVQFCVVIRSLNISRYKATVYTVYCVFCILCLINDWEDINYFYVIVCTVYNYTCICIIIYYVYFIIGLLVGATIIAHMMLWILWCMYSMQLCICIIRFCIIKLIYSINFTSITFIVHVANSLCLQQALSNQEASIIKAVRALWYAIADGYILYIAMWYNV